MDANYDGQSPPFVQRVPRKCRSTHKLGSMCTDAMTRHAHPDYVLNCGEQRVATGLGEQRVAPGLGHAHPNSPLGFACPGSPENQDMQSKLQSQTDHHGHVI
jgi:hypothetical protein